MKRPDVLWGMRRDEVWKEIARLLNVEKASFETEGWFTKRTTAMGNIIDRMTKEQLAELDAQVEEIQQQGYPEEQQRA